MYLIMILRIRFRKRFQRFSDLDVAADRNMMKKMYDHAAAFVDSMEGISFLTMQDVASCFSPASPRESCRYARLVSRRCSRSIALAEVRNTRDHRPVTQSPSRALAAVTNFSSLNDRLLSRRQVVVPAPLGNLNTRFEILSPTSASPAREGLFHSRALIGEVSTLEVVAPALRAAALVKILEVERLDFIVLFSFKVYINCSF